jgi:long-chain acyl-CoA synthetase
MVLQTGRFDPVTTMTLIQRERVAVWSGVPTTVGRVVEHPRRDEFDLSSLRVLAMGGAPLPPRMLADAATAMPNVRRGVSANYGLTEAGGSVATARGEELLSHPGCSGRPLPAIELRIDGPPTAGEADAPAVGEILLRGPSTMSGYWPLDGPAPVDEDGWLRTGDVGYLDGDGFLYVTDRVRDIVIRGGENISASHVEFTLCEHPEIAAAVVVGLPHADLGEEVAAVLVARSPGPRTDEPVGAQVDELIKSVRAFAAARLAHFEVPSRWWVRPGPLPENATGKIDKKVLRAQWPEGER